jgi:glycerol dehydrogenase
MLQVFCAPSRYTQGKNATAALGRELTTLGLHGPALIVAGRTAARQLAGTWASCLGEAGISHTVLDFGGECSLGEIEKIKTAARNVSARVIVGAGGGKVLDAVRAAAADLELAVVNCPTVASTDSPTSALSVIYTDDGAFQEYRFYRRNPDLVLVDTQVIAESPPRSLVAGMGDAISTYFEARTSVAAHCKNMRGGASTISALALAELCYQTVLENGVQALRAIEARAVTPALERVVEANTLLSGLGFESSGLAAAHSIHNGLTAAHETHDFLHGEKVAFGVLVQLVLEGAPGETFDVLLAFYAGVGLPCTLAEIGLESPSAETLRLIAERAIASGETIHNEPFEVDAGMVVDAILAADAIGRTWKGEASHCEH